MQLPPKRFQSDQDPKYDDLRHLPWFKDLAQRRDKIAMLELAHNDYLWADMTQAESCENWGVDKRELRDYSDFVGKRDKLAEIEPIGTRRSYQHFLDHCYDVYHERQGAKSFTQVMHDESRLFGIEARPFIELWETCAMFYPSHYRGTK